MYRRRDVIASVRWSPQHHNRYNAYTLVTPNYNSNGITRNECSRCLERAVQCTASVRYFVLSRDIRIHTLLFRRFQIQGAVGRGGPWYACLEGSLTLGEDGESRNIRPRHIFVRPTAGARRSGQR